MRQGENRCRLLIHLRVVQPFDARRPAELNHERVLPVRRRFGKGIPVSGHLSQMVLVQGENQAGLFGLRDEHRSGDIACSRGA